MIAILSTLLLFVWVALAFPALPECPDFSKSLMERPRISMYQVRHYSLVIVAVILGGMGFYIRYYFSDQNQISYWLWNLIFDLAPEMIGMAFTLLVIDQLQQLWAKQQEQEQEKEKLIRQMGSDSNSFALDALRQIKQEHWLYRGDLCGQLFRHANLQEAHLESADLREADFTGANLQHSSLIRANLQRARLKVAHLQGAELHHANLQGAVLENADLREAILYDTNLQGANLHGAYLQAANLSHANLRDADLSWANYSGDTVWPHGFDPKAAQAIKMKWDAEGKKWIHDR